MPELSGSEVSDQPVQAPTTEIPKSLEDLLSPEAWAKLRSDLAKMASNRAESEWEGRDVRM